MATINFSKILKAIRSGQSVHISHNGRKYRVTKKA